MKKQPNRLPKGGRIDRGKAFSIKFDGRKIDFTNIKYEENK